MLWEKILIKAGERVRRVGEGEICDLNMMLREDFPDKVTSEQSPKGSGVFFSSAEFLGKKSLPERENS